jgi:hypothetical protein
MKVYYCNGYKNQLRHDFEHRGTIYPIADIHTELVSLYTSGLFKIRKYFAWDGCSGPTLDTKTTDRGCLVHDAYYYLMRIEELPCAWKDEADLTLKRLMLEDGAPRWRAEYYYWAVRLFGGRCILKSSQRKIYVSP